MATKITMYYNPYLCTVKLSMLDAEGAEMPIDGRVKDEVSQKFNERFCLEDDGDALLDILTEAYRGSQINIEFVGTTENFHSFRKQCEWRQVQLVQSSKRRILSCDEINKKIIDKVLELKGFGYDIDSDGEIDKILDATIPVIVVGSTSAGKSTFLNALIGEELLPTGQNRTTGVSCALRNSPEEFRVEFCMNGEVVNLDCTDQYAIENSAAIPEDLARIIKGETKPLDRIRCIIDYFNFIDKDAHIDRTALIDNKQLDVFCPFYNEKIPGRIVFYDTPGDGSDSFEVDEVTLENILKEQTKGLLIFVCKERAGLDKAEKLIRKIQTATENKLDLAHTIVVCNCMEAAPDCSGQTSTEKKWASRIIYVSSGIALSARKPAVSKDDWKENNLFFLFARNGDAFSDPNNMTYTSLPQYCSLPSNRTTDFEAEHKKLKRELEIATDTAQKKRQLMQFNSGITTVEQEIIFVTKELFPYNQCERARRVFLQLLGAYKEEIAQKEKEKQDQRKSRIAEFESIYAPICEELENYTNDFIREAGEDFVARAKSSDYRWTKEKAGDFATHAIERYLKSQYYKEHNEVDIYEKIEALLDEDIHNYTKRAEQDLNDFLIEKALRKYADACKQKINSQTTLSEEERQVFRSFFTMQRLADQTKEKRKDVLGKVNLNIPQLRENLSGDAWYVLVRNFIANIAKSAKYGMEKAFGPIKRDLAECHDKAFIECSQNVLGQAKKCIEEIFSRIKKAFSEESADDNIICSLNPKLADIRRVIKALENDIKELGSKRCRIETELKQLDEIFSN